MSQLQEPDGQNLPHNQIVPFFAEKTNRGDYDIYMQLNEGNKCLYRHKTYNDAKTLLLQLRIQNLINFVTWFADNFTEHTREMAYFRDTVSTALELDEDEEDSDANSE